MDLPELNHAEYMALVHQYLEYTEEDDIELFWLQAMDPDQLFQDDWDEPDKRGLVIQYLNVHKPHMYRTKHGNTRIIFPITEDQSYNQIDTVWPSTISPFGYLIRENRYDDLSETDFYFRWGMEEGDGKQSLPKYDRNDWRTH